MALLVFIAACVFAATPLHVAGQEGFLSIDCGLDDQFSGRRAFPNITYVSDGAYVDGGENHKIADDQVCSAGGDISLRTLRSFPSGVRNCYTLPTQSGARYLLRVSFMYGNYDGKNSASSVQFDLHLGTNHWATVNNVTNWRYEAVLAAWASWVPLCLINTGGGTPFISKLELRQLGSSLYPDVNTDQPMSLYTRRRNYGSTTFIRYPDDPTDRIWGPFASPANSSFENLSTENTILKNQDSFAVPNPVLQTAITTAGNGTVINVMTWTNPALMFKVFLHFTDFQKSQFRQFDIYMNDERLENYSPIYLTASTVQNSGWSKTTNGTYNITLVATNTSVLSPMINALELYSLIPNVTSRTFSKDFDTMMAIKHDYGVKNNWMGDPCFPAIYRWKGVLCSNSTDNTARIISLDMSNSKLNGSISDNFKLLTELQFLNLSGNSLNGPIPYTLCKKNGGPLVFRSESGEDMCSKTISAPSSRNKIAIITFQWWFLWWYWLHLVFHVSSAKRRESTKVYTTCDPLSVPKHKSALGDITSHGDQLHNSENRKFTYMELEKFTNKFERSIGQGGFGLVYYGRLEDNTEVAVKMRSESSLHGLDEFLAEVNSLTKVHHRNLVSLVGYCWEKDHLALVYEYMSRGSLCDQLRGKQGVGETMGWGTRVRIVLESAQGLDYLHRGCSLPIIHRDVKTNNILLGQNMRAKIADFGLCKTYLSDMQTHISTNAAGSAGYMDPEYYHTGWLTESSDIYSLGVVLLEVATGEPPILPGHGHIVHRVKQKIASGDISLVVDALLGGAYDVNSMWKLVDTAMACTADSAIQRPTMSFVVAQLKESLALEESRENSSVKGSFTSNTGDQVSIFGPSAR